MRFLSNQAQIVHEQLGSFTAPFVAFNNSSIQIINEVLPFLPPSIWSASQSSQIEISYVGLADDLK